MSTALVTPTLGRIIKEARIFLNQPNAENSFWTDEELGLWANDGIRTFFLETSERAEGQFDKTALLDVTTNQETVALPSDFFEVKALYIAQGQQYTILPYKNNLTEVYNINNSGTSDSYNGYYYFRNNSIVLRPIPGFTQAGGLKLEYIALPDVLIGNSDTVSGISPVYKELIVLHVVYKAKVKEDLVNNSNTSEKAAALLADAYNKFKETVGKRSKYPTGIIPYNPY